MNKTIIILIIITIALAAGVGGAYAVSRVITSSQALNTGTFENCQIGQPGSRCEIPGEQSFPRCGGDSDDYPGGQPGTGCQRSADRGWMGPGMMGPGMVGRGRYSPDITQQGERISIDEAAAYAEEYVSQLDADLKVVEVMEFSQNFYVVVVEGDTEMGAMELLIDPQSGRVSTEIGPNHMWNSKYGRMRWSVDDTVSNTVSMEEAVKLAQAALDAEFKGAVVEPDGIEFYGYYSFDYKIDDQVAGMLSVNGTSGQVWFHNWHGTFIAEKEMEE